MCDIKIESMSNILKEDKEELVDNNVNTSVPGEYYINMKTWEEIIMAAESNMKNMAICLTAVCLLCSSLLGGVYAMTKSPL